MCVGRERKQAGRLKPGGAAGARPNARLNNRNAVTGRHGADPSQAKVVDRTVYDSRNAPAGREALSQLHRKDPGQVAGR